MSRPAEGVRPATALERVLASPQLPALDGIRAVAVLIVVLGHLGRGVIPAEIGVTIFFVLSGFLITWLLINEQERNDTISLRKFYARRALRIFPAYYGYILFTVLLDSALGDFRWRQLLPWALSYTVNYYNALHNHPSTSFAHAWSLAVEEQFYLLWPPLAAVLLPRPRRSAALVLGAIIGITVALRGWLYLVVGVGSAYVYNAFETRMDSLAIGCLLAVCIGLPGAGRIAEKFAGRPWMPVPVLLAYVAFRALESDGVHYALGFTVESLLVATLLVQMLVSTTTWPWRMLELAPVRYVGRISYALYLYHGWGNALGAKLMRSPGIGQTVLQLLCCIALASGSYYVVEQPFLRWKQRFRA